MTAYLRKKYVLDGDVFTAALARINWLFDEFETVAVSSSGGKDSTAVVELALRVARERDRLPLKVHWLDQECEFESTVLYQRRIAQRDEIDFGWYQIPFRLYNATSHDSAWLNVWGEGEDWVREKEPGSIHENTFGTDRFVEALHAIGDREAPDGVVLTGVRADESPARRAGLTTYPTYKWATWGAKPASAKRHILMHPIYDWANADVWTAIANEGWDYNVHYDHMHRYGVPPSKMRVSNYHHETAIHSLFYLQEVEPETYERATARLAGISTAAHIGRDDYFVHDLPFMFGTWREYRDYLLENLITDDADRAEFAKQFAGLDATLPYVDPEKISRAEVNALIANDVYYTKLNQFFVLNHLAKEQREEWHRANPAAAAV